MLYSFKSHVLKTQFKKVLVIVTIVKIVSVYTAQITDVTPKPNISDVLMMKLISYYEDKYSIAESKSKPVEINNQENINNVVEERNVMKFVGNKGIYMDKKPKEVEVQVF
ncbi:unnamed protein product, partial [Iphiclides podalirius]